MRYEARLRRLERKFPKPLPERIVRWGPRDKPWEIFSTRGWSIGFDENGVFKKVGNVPPEYGEHLLAPPLQRRDQAKEDPCRD